MKPLWLNRKQRKKRHGREREKRKMGDKREQEINKEIEIKSVKEKEKIFKYSILILNDRMTCSKRWNNISQLISLVSVINSVRN